MFFNEVVGKKNKHKNRKAIWFEYIIIIRIPGLCTELFTFSTYGAGKRKIFLHQNKPAATWRTVPYFAVRNTIAFCTFG
jgi:hypothetical protein